MVFKITVDIYICKLIYFRVNKFTLYMYMYENNNMQKCKVYLVQLLFFLNFCTFNILMFKYFSIMNAITNIGVPSLLHT